MLGFIGCGAMGGAICRGICSAGEIPPSHIGVYDIDSDKVRIIAEETGVRSYENCADLIAKADMLLLAVKPHIVEQVLSAFREDLAGHSLISIAAGWSTSMLSAQLDRSTRVLCAMPNTAALVGEAMTALAKQTTFLAGERDRAEKLFSYVGKTAWVDEKQIPAVIGVSGSGPAYAYMFLQAIADGGVEAGLTRKQAQEMAVQMLLGAARMAERSGMHPEALKDMVCSPGGTTIAAVHALENGGFRGTVMDAVAAAAQKAGELA